MSFPFCRMTGQAQTELKKHSLTLRIKPKN